MKKIILSLTVSVFLLNACATDPYTGQSKVSKTAWGTGIGTAVGTGIGALIGGEKGALLGAGIGAGVGAASGGYMDLQARKLRQELAGTGVQVQDINGNIKLIIPGNITFGFNDSNIQASFKPVLDSIAKVMEEYNKTNIQIIGYTDNIGTLEYNQQLSLRRADTVATYLNLRGVPQSRIVTYGAGPSNPIAGNDTEFGREQNRRVEITLISQQ